MKVTLLDDVSKLGRRGEVRDVADGYGRNFLIPRGLAVVEVVAERVQFMGRGKGGAQAPGQAQTPETFADEGTRGGDDVPFYRAMHSWITDRTRAAMSGESANRPRKAETTT